MGLDEHSIRSTVVLFGGARVPAPEAGDGSNPELGKLSHYYDEARRFAHAITTRSLAGGGTRQVIVTGAGPGVMEAGNRGAAEAGGKSIGLSIVLPHEQAPNAYVSPELCFNFHYFAIRKMHFLMRAEAVCVFPGGYGTMDEMFETLTLIQTGAHAPNTDIAVRRGFLAQDNKLGGAGGIGHNLARGLGAVSLCRNLGPGDAGHGQLGRRGRKTGRYPRALEPGACVT